MSGFGSSARATQPFPCVMPPLRDDQYISLSPTDSPGDDAETDLAAAALVRPLKWDAGKWGRV